MITSLSSLDLILAKNEFIKDYGVSTQSRRDALLVRPIYKDTQGNTHFEVMLNGDYVERDWEIVKVDLSRLSDNHFKVENKNPTKKIICELVHRATGHNIIQADIANVEKITGGWMVYIDQSSLRYSGSFKIKNH